MNGFIRFIAFVSVLMGSLLRASAEDILLVVGAPGTTEYGNEFSEWQKRWESIANTAQLEMKVIGPGGSGEDDDRTLLASEIETQVEASESRPLWLIFVGHGTWDGISARFNLVGPDVDARELAKMLKPCKRPLVVVNCTSSSGPFIDRLSGAGRVVVTATKSGSEQNFARFGGYFAQALSEPGSDLDHDDAVSVREAFLKAATQTGVFYEQEGRIATEHAMIDDNGDKKGSRVELLRGTKKLSGDGKLDGELAGRITIPVSDDVPRLNEEQTKRRDELEKELRKLLGARGADRDTDVLRARALPILVKLAELYRQAETEHTAKP